MNYPYWRSGLGALGFGLGGGVQDVLRLLDSNPKNNPSLSDFILPTGLGAAGFMGAPALARRFQVNPVPIVSYKPSGVSPVEKPPEIDLQERKNKTIQNIEKNQQYIKDYMDIDSLRTAVMDSSSLDDLNILEKQMQTIIPFGRNEVLSTLAKKISTQPASWTRRDIDSLILGGTPMRDTLVRSALGFPVQDKGYINSVNTLPRGTVPVPSNLLKMWNEFTDINRPNTPIPPEMASLPYIYSVFGGKGVAPEKFNKTLHQFLRIYRPAFSTLSNQ